MKFCPDCGTGHDCAEQSSGPSEAVQLARIQADRDVKVAEIEHRDAKAEVEAEVEVAAIEAEAGVEAAEAVAGALTDVLAPEPEPAPVPAAVAAPIVIEDSEPEDAPPPREERDHPTEPRETARKTGFF